MMLILNIYQFAANSPGYPIAHANLMSRVLKDNILEALQ